MRFVSEDGASRARCSPGPSSPAPRCGAVYDGVLEMHRHFLACVRDGRPATSSLEDALETMRLVQRIERAEH